MLQYALGANWALACAALAALKQRPDRDEVVDEIVRRTSTSSTPGRCISRSSISSPPSRGRRSARRCWAPRTGGARTLSSPCSFATTSPTRERLGDAPSFGSALQAANASPPATIKAFLQRINHPYAAALIGQLEASSAPASIALSRLVRPLLEGPQGHELLVEPEAGGRRWTAAESGYRWQTPARSLLVSGEHRVGKTSFLRLLAKRLEGRGWTVFEAGGADLMAGQQWFGQLEGRIQRAVEELAASKKLIWYIPDILQLARSGTHQGQAASILDQILPAISSGRPDRVDRGIADEHGAPRAVAADAARRAGGGAPGAAVAGGDRRRSLAPSCSGWRTRRTSRSTRRACRWR